MEYQELRETFVFGLEAAAVAHDSGDFKRIEVGYDEADGLVPRNHDTRYDKLHIALHFWDGWIDARNHGWLFYEGLSAADWPVLARRIAQDLREDREIGDERVLHHFDLRRKAQRPSMWRRVRNLVSGR